MQRPGRTGVIAALALLIAAAVVVVLVVRSSPGAASGSTGSAGTTGGSATVRRRNLVATDTESGTLSYAGAQTVYNRLGGTVTWLPPVGRTINPGGVLYRVDGQPVVLMSGSVPAYRTLSAADVDGHDVLELNRNLKRLGFDATEITVDDVWQSATSLGVEELQESLGEDPTGSLALGQVVFLPGPQLVSSLDTTVGSTGSGGGSAGAAQDSSSAPLAGSAEFVSSTTPIPTTGGSTTATTTTTTTTTTSSPTHGASRTTPTTSTTSSTPTASTQPPSDGATGALSALAKQLKAETSQLKAATAALKAAAKSSHHSSSHHSSGGSGSSGGGSAQAILQTTSTRLVVTVDISASSQSEARVGEHVSVEMPAGNTVHAKITAVSRIAQSAGSGGDQGTGQGGGSGGSSSSTVPVTIALLGRHQTAGLDQAAVSVDFVSQRARNVLSVPVTALVATSGNRYALQEARAPHTLIPVTVGLFAAGYVQVSGSAVRSGLAVTDSQG